MFTMALVMSLTVLASCGGAPSNAEVGKIIDKYDETGELTEGEWGTLLDYIDAGLNDALPLAKEAQKAIADDDYDKLEKLEAKGEKLEEKYPHMDKVERIFNRVDEDEIGAANIKKAEKIKERMMELFD